ncbi:MAG TPA: hypothetical protein VK543_11470 [Puia sp.]|nr:hypothetical protein [Puia sp.]
MLQKISWSDFIVWSITVPLVYYTYVIAFYYKKEIVSFFQDLSKTNITGPTPPAGSLKRSELDATSNKDNTSPEPEIPMSVIYDLMEDLKNILLEAADKVYHKEELIQALRRKIGNIPARWGAAAQQDVNEHITVETFDKCGINLTVEDMKRIWGY